ncbi:unnamed protein product, partial [Rotaria sp. Silwood2]
MFEPLFRISRLVCIAFREDKSAPIDFNNDRKRTNYITVNETEQETKSLSSRIKK